MSFECGELKVVGVNTCPVKRRFHSLYTLFTERLTVVSASGSIHGINRHPGY
jgi:hypothetical protein